MAKYNFNNYLKFTNFIEHLPQNQNHQFKSLLSERQWIGKGFLQAALNVTDMAPRSLATAVVLRVTVPMCIPYVGYARAPCA